MSSNSHISYVPTVREITLSLWSNEEMEAQFVLYLTTMGYLVEMLIWPGRAGWGTGQIWFMLKQGFFSVISVDLQILFVYFLKRL